MSSSKLSLLVSYEYLRDQPALSEIVRLTSPTIQWMIDSGAFSSFMKGRKAAMQGKHYSGVQVDRYIEWLHQMRQNVWQYVALDALGQKDVTAVNLKAMCDAGLRPMPVLVVGESESIIPQYMEINDHICVAGCGRSPMPWARQRIWRAFNASDGKAKLHVLSFVRTNEIRALPLTTVDSSSWNAGGTFGTVAKYGGNGKLSILGKITTPRAIEYAMACGAPIAGKKATSGAASSASLLTAAASVTLQRAYKRFGKTVFLAMASTDAIMILAACDFAVREAKGAYPSYETITAGLAQLRAIGVKNPVAIADAINALLTVKKE